MNQFIPFHKPNTKSEEWKDDGPSHFSNQTHPKFPADTDIDIFGVIAIVLSNAWILKIEEPIWQKEAIVPYIL